MEKAKIRPFATPKPINLQTTLACLIMSGTAFDTQKFVSIGSWVSSPQIRYFDVLLG